MREGGGQNMSSGVPISGVHAGKRGFVVAPAPVRELAADLIEDSRGLARLVAIAPRHVVTPLVELDGVGRGVVLVAPGMNEEVAVGVEGDRALGLERDVQIPLRLRFRLGEGPGAPIRDVGGRGSGAGASPHVAVVAVQIDAVGLDLEMPSPSVSAQVLAVIPEGAWSRSCTG
jgi:hypothetical protein